MARSAQRLDLVSRSGFSGPGRLGIVNKERQIKIWRRAANENMSGLNALPARSEIIAPK
jgi:hypothetical protein